MNEQEERHEQHVHELRRTAVLAIPLAFVVVIPLIAVGVLWRHEQNARITDAKQIAVQIEAERVARGRALNAFVYEQCIENEIRDVVIVEQLRAAKARARETLPPGLRRDEQLDTIQAGIDALEPENEESCRPPPVTPAAKP